MKKLLTILFILIAAQSFAQEQGVYQKLPIYGAQYKRLKADSALHIPTFCGVPTLLSVVGNQSAIAYDSCGHKFYVYNPTDSTWIVGNLSGTDSSSYHTIGQASDSSYFTISKPDGTVTTVYFPTFYNKVNYTDSNSVYVTPSQLRDSMGTEYDKYPLYHDGDTLKFRNDSLPLLTYGADVDTSGTSAMDIPVKKWVLDRISVGSGSPNSNIGSGYRLAVPLTNNIKTIFAVDPILLDSVTNTNSLTFKFDTSLYHSTAYNNTQYGSLSQQNTNTSNIASNTTAIAGKQDALTLTTTGTGGAATLTGSTLNIPQYTGGGGGSTVVNDSLAQGFKISDSSVTGQALAPYDLTWNKIHTQRYFTLIDENFINYKSSWEAQQMLEDTAVSGSAPTISNGNLQVTGSSIIKTNTGPVAAFFTVEAAIKSISYTGTFNAVGPAIVKDATHYIAGIYDPVAGKAYIQINGTNVLTKSITLDSSSLKLYLIVTGNSINLWAKSNGSTYYIGGFDNDQNLMIDSVLSTYKYGLMTSSSSSSGSTIFSYLRGGASGGGGLLNVRMVINEDGSPYTYGNKLLFTADLASSTGQTPGPTNHNYAVANACVFMMDINTFQVETVGRFYFNRSNGGTEVRTTGGTNIKLTWFPSKKQWLLIYDYFDWDTGNPYANDAYAWLDYEAPFGQTEIKESQLNAFGINKTTYPNLFYDVSARYINGTWYALGSYTNAPLGSSWSAAKPVMFSGPSLSSLTAYVEYNSSTFLECSSFFKLGGQWYINVFSYQDTKGLVLSFPNLDSLGNLQLPYNVSSGIAGIPGYEVLPYQKNDNTQYYLFGFDTYNSVINGTEYPWSRGNLVVFKSKQTSTGYEFPNKVANQISFPVKDVVNTSGRFPKDNEYYLNNTTQTIAGKKNFDTVTVTTLTASNSITSPTITANTAFVTGNNTSNSTARFGALEFQSFAVNNNWFGDNTYFNGTNFVRRSAGYSGLFYFAGNEGQFRLGANSTAGSTVTQIIPFKVNLDGTVAMGGTSMLNAVGNYTGATFLANASGVTITGKIKLNTGTNASMGTGTLSSGATTISTTAVTASSLIFIQYTSCSNCGSTYISAKSAGTSFTVTSTNASDASTFNWWIVN